MSAFDDRLAAEGMEALFSATELAEMENLTRTVTMKSRPVALRTNCETGESISPSGVFCDDDVARLERVRREQLARRSPPPADRTG